MVGFHWLAPVFLVPFQGIILTFETENSEKGNDVGRDQCTVFQSFERSILIRPGLPTRPGASSKKPGGFCKVGIRLAVGIRRAQRAKPAELVCWPASHIVVRSKVTSRILIYPRFLSKFQLQRKKIFLNYRKRSETALSRFSWIRRWTLKKHSSKNIDFFIFKIISEKIIIPKNGDPAPELEAQITAFIIMRTV